MIDPFGADHVLWGTEMKWGSARELAPSSSSRLPQTDLLARMRIAEETWFS